VIVMRVVLQRVSEGTVTVEGNEVARIGHGYVILLGVKQGDTPDDVMCLADKCANLRIFEDAQGKMNLSVKDVGGSAIVVSQFTLYADARKGNRPGFSLAAPGAVAEPLYEQFVARLRATLGEQTVCTGVFGAMMKVHIVNDGPVTVLIESPSHTGEGAEP
jgi:D-tyrosyl-tRNA(Tyr) deacylase